MKIRDLINLILGGIVVASPAFAATSYPMIGGITISESSTAADYIVYFFNLCVAAGSFIAVVIVIMAGIEYITAQGEPAKIDSAKKKIQASFLGLVILFASYMILNIINPQLAKIKIDKLSNSSGSEIAIKKGLGVYLYNSTNFSDQGKSLYLINDKPELINDQFNDTAKSIKFVNPDDGSYKFGAVLFTQSDYRSDNGQYCSYALNNISNLDASSGNENNPAIKNNDLSSIIVFKTKPGSSTVTFYNNIDCQKRSEDYCRKNDPKTPCMEEKNTKCVVSSGDGFKNIKEICPDFKGDVLSMEISGKAAILLKAVDKTQGGRCQFFTPANNTCFNTVKSSYVYKPEYMPQDVLTPEEMIIFKPVSYMLFPLYVEQ